MPLAAGDLLQITYMGSLYGQQIMTVLHARCKTPPTGTPQTELVLDDLAVKISDPVTFDLTAKYMAAACDEFNFTACRVQRVKPTRSIYAEAPMTQTGHAGPGVPAANIAASIEKRSLVPGRKGVGRVQFAPLPATAIGSGYIQDAWLLGFGADFAEKLYGTFIGGPLYNSGEYRWCLPAGGADEAYDIWDALIQDTVRTMHRRTVGLGI